MAISAAAIEEMIRNNIDGVAEIKVEEFGNKYQLRVVAEHFSGLNPVKRQQSIYRVLQTYISSGEIHAVSMKLLSPAEQDR